MEADIAHLFSEAGCENIPTKLILNKSVREKLDPHDSKKSLQYKVRTIEHEEGNSYHVHIKNFKTGETINRILIPNEMSDEGKQEIADEVVERDQQDEAQTFIRNESAAVEAARQFNLAEEAGHTLYMREKRINKLYGARIRRIKHDETLIIPAKDIEGKLWSIQLIYKYGKNQHKKLFLPGSTYAGCFFQFGEVKDITDAIFFAEGWATAATIYELQGRPTICCFSAGNLKNVATEFRKLYPDLTFVIASDFDETGQSKGRTAAKAVGAIHLQSPMESPHPSITDWNDYKEYEGEMKAVSKLIEFDQQPKELTKQEWMKEWMKENRVHINFKGVVRRYGKTSSADQLARSIHLQQEREYRKIPLQLIHHFVSDYLDEKHSELFASLTAPIFEESMIPLDLNNPVRDFIVAAIGRDDEVAYHVMRHFIWQVKRKIKGMPVEHHMMPVFIGPSDGGKSVAVEKLLSPIKELHITSSMTACGDKGQWDIFAKFPVVFMDEMAGAAKTDMNYMKQLITAIELTFRAPYDRRSKTVPNISTLIGTSNEHLEEIVRDTTSNRRFFPVECQRQLDWEAINSTNYMGLWQSVSHEEDCPLLPVYGEVKAVQEEHRNKSIVEQWLDEVKEEPVGPCSTPTAKLFKNFETWKDENGMKHFTLTTQKFGLELKRLGYEKVGRSSKGTKWNVKVVGIEADANF